jgi:hypothetical protein
VGYKSSSHVCVEIFSETHSQFKVWHQNINSKMKFLLALALTITAALAATPVERDTPTTTGVRLPVSR